MATGDQNDIVNRIKMTLPNRWFGDTSPILNAVLGGIAYALSLAYNLIQYAKNQTRIATASDGFLDLISYDFFGIGLPRKSGEYDAPYRARILAGLLRERATRNGIVKALVALTGRTPTIFEPTRPQDTGSYNANNMGYGVAGAYGSLLLNNQAFITAYRALNAGIPNIAGYGNSQGAYNTASQTEYASLSFIVGAVQDADIYAAIDAAKPAGSIMWTTISS
jgi:hypothetical protein